MRYLYVTFTILLAGLFILNGCKKDEKSNPVSFIDGYTVNYTEPTGTTYTGNFFPLEAGYMWNYYGNADIDMTLIYPGSPPMKDSTVGPASGMMKVLPQQHVPLPSGTVLLYPIVDETDVQGSAADTSRYFMKDTAAVYVKAIKLGDGSFMEVTNPLFIKSRLVVGDSWLAAPDIDMTKLLSSESEISGFLSNPKLDATAKFFVVGKEQINLPSPFGNRDAIRLEQANDVTMSGSMTVQDTSGYTMTMTMNMDAKLSVVYHLIADTGIVHQNTTGPMNMTITISYQGTQYTATMNMVINECDLRLVSFGPLPYPVSSVSSVVTTSTSSAKRPPSFNTETQEKVWKLSKAIAKIITKRLSL